MTKSIKANKIILEGGLSTKNDQIEFCFEGELFDGLKIEGKLTCKIKDEEEIFNLFSYTIGESVYKVVKEFLIEMKRFGSEGEIYDAIIEHYELYM